MTLKDNFFKWVKSIHGSYLIRVSSDCSVFYKVGKNFLRPIHSCISFNQRTGEFSRDFIEKCKELNIDHKNCNFFTDNSFEDLIKNLNTSCSLDTFSKSKDYDTILNSITITNK